jgi:hypothetical protein
MTAYSLTRFMSNLSPKLAKQIIKHCNDGEQFDAAAIPRDALPNVTILAAFGSRIDVEIVDDYDKLLDRLRTACNDGNVHHPDLFLATSIALMAQRGQDITLGGFEAVGVPDIFAELFGDQDEEES